MFNVRIYLLLIVYILSGCAATLSTHRDVHDDLPSLKNIIVVGKTTRNEVSESLGEPFIRNAQYRVEVYRVLLHSDTSTQVLIFPPIPAWSKTETTAYALVIYDNNMIVKDVAWGGDTLVADDFYFSNERYDAVISERITEILFSRLSDSQEFLRKEAPKGGCLLHISPGAHVHEIVLDDKELASYPMDRVSGYNPYSKPVKSRVWFKGFMTMPLSTGEHVLSITTLHFKPSEFKRTFFCNSGEVFYAHSNLELFQWTEKLAWKQYRFRVPDRGSVNPPPLGGG